MNKNNNQTEVFGLLPYLLHGVTGRGKGGSASFSNRFGGNKKTSPNYSEALIETPEPTSYVQPNTNAKSHLFYSAPTDLTSTRATNGRFYYPECPELSTSYTEINNEIILGNYQGYN